MTNHDQLEPDVVAEVAVPAVADDPVGDLAYSLAAEVRAVEDGHVARVLPDGSILVKADSRPGNYRVRIRQVDGGVVHFSCTCPSGFYRDELPVPCKHAARAGRRLEREGLARWRGGHWHLRAPAALRAALAATVGSDSRSDRSPSRAPRPRRRWRPGGGAPAGECAAA